MKHITLNHLYSGQALAHSWMHITEADATKYPHDNGYMVFYQGKVIGEAVVRERRKIKVGTINDTLSMMITGYSKAHLITDLKDRNIPCEDDSLVYLFCFQWMHYFERFRSLHQEAFEINYIKHRPKAAQMSFNHI
jgi:hypothetical protein